MGRKMELNLLKDTWEKRIRKPSSFSNKPIQPPGTPELPKGRRCGCHGDRP